MYFFQFEVKNLSLETDTQVSVICTHTHPPPVVVIGWSEVGRGGATGTGEALTVALRPGRRRLSITHRGFYQRAQCVCLGYRPCVSLQCEAVRRLPP